MPLKPRSTEDDVVCKFALTSNTNRNYAFTVKAASSVKSETNFGGFYVGRPNNKPAFGIRSSVVPLGRSQTMTLDVVSLFSSDQDTQLGGALSYNCLLGTGYRESLRGIFGFPVKLCFTIGFQGLNTARIDAAKGPFYGIGFSIPTGG